MSLSKITKSRYLSIPEVADLLEVEKSTQLERLRYVRRLFRKMEERDGVVYLHPMASSKGRQSRYRICVDDLALLDPWSAETTQALRKDVDALERENQELRRRIARLERFAEDTTKFLPRCLLKPA